MKRGTLLRTDWRSKRIRSLERPLVGAAILILVLIAYFRDLGRNPFGFFCDEALIGIRAQQLLDGDNEVKRLSFFYDHFGTVAGSVTIYATVPFVWLFGLNEFAVRFTSVFFTLATFGVLYLTFRHLNLTRPWLPVLIFALTPIVIHLSRVNFGHAPSIFLIALGYYLYLRSKRSRNSYLTIVAGILIGLSTYGYPGFYVATPVFIGIVLATECIAVRFQWRQMILPLLFGLTAVAMLMPVVHEYRTNPNFDQRFKDKDANAYGLVSVERAESMLANYPKYYDYDFLFEDGDTSPIQRHSVRDAGLLSLPLLPLLVLGLLSFGLARIDVAKRAFAPFVALLFLAPVPDLITTRAGVMPYTFALFTGALLVPFVVAYALETIEAHRRYVVERSTTQAPSETVIVHEHPNPMRQIWTQVISNRFITAIILMFGFFFVFSTYANYPLVASGYWGWQAGPRDAIGYYLDHETEYDAFYLQGQFNQPGVFLDFYIANPEARAKARIGDATEFTPRMKQLFAVTRETFENAMVATEWQVVDLVTYPDGSIAFYLIQHVRN